MNRLVSAIRSAIRHCSAIRLYYGRSPHTVRGPALILCPTRPLHLHCGLAGIVAFKSSQPTEPDPPPIDLAHQTAPIFRRPLSQCTSTGMDIADQYLGGADAPATLLQAVSELKRDAAFWTIFKSARHQKNLADTAKRIKALVVQETTALNAQTGRMTPAEIDTAVKRIETLKDIHWGLKHEILSNIQRVQDLLQNAPQVPTMAAVHFAKKLNAVLNSIDRLEVRGRDSAGISMMFILSADAFDQFTTRLQDLSLQPELETRSQSGVLVNRQISIGGESRADGNGPVCLTFTYKRAAEIGGLGDNIRFLREQISTDQLFLTVLEVEHRYATICSHTRWASVGAITEPNCHPVESRTQSGVTEGGHVIHVCLNGDIDNYQALRAEHESRGGCIHADITTDTIIIPLQIEKYLVAGHDITEAFRLAVNDFEGSHAISMHTDLAPGRIFLAQRGSGQSVFVGIAADHYMPVSEVYGFIEETSHYLKMDGERVVDGPTGPTQGQILILDQNTTGGLAGISAQYYDGSRIELTAEDILQTQITSRDIDRQEFPHYFLKEITESPRSVERTLQSRWRIDTAHPKDRVVDLSHQTVPKNLRRAFSSGEIQRIFFTGQGTAGVAAMACADILSHYLGNSRFQISAQKASELSGFRLADSGSPDSMRDTLVIAISQSGTTTDTNRTVDLVRERGAHTLAIVNRRDSDLTFKVDGVMYTSSGRDIEMSVASTKAFYAQIVAGALLGLFFCGLVGKRDRAFISRELGHLLALPDVMRQILAKRDEIAASAKRLASSRIYWAAVGSGPNKASADEIRIKLSELCYKTISTDYVEDKKHIDLSSEPLIIVCAAGTRATVIGDIIKDTAIFRAHKAAPVVIADAGEDRFTPYAEYVLHVPKVPEHLAPIVNTLVGHIWGYYAALSIHTGSEILFRFREELAATIDAFATRGLDIYEAVLESEFREQVAQFYRRFRTELGRHAFSAVLGLETAANLTLLLKYLSGRLPVSDFELDFGKKGTARNMLDTLLEGLNSAINTLARPIDAIKHQAKTVTVGTSRISDRIEGILFDSLAEHRIAISQLTNTNVIVLRNIQEVIASIQGAILYRVGGLTLLGEVSADTTIEVITKQGVLAPIPSRVETDTRLKGTKRIIVQQGNVYIGKGRKDDRSIVVIPILSETPGAVGIIDRLLLLNIIFKPQVPLEVKMQALGGKREHIVNIVQENSVAWKDTYLELMPMDELFGRSAEKLAEAIVAQVRAQETI